MSDDPKQRGTICQDCKSAIVDDIDPIPCRSINLQRSEKFKFNIHSDDTFVCLDNNSERGTLVYRNVWDGSIPVLLECAHREVYPVTIPANDSERISDILSELNRMARFAHTDTGVLPERDIRPESCAGLEAAKDKRDKALREHKAAADEYYEAVNTIGCTLEQTDELHNRVSTAYWEFIEASTAVNNWIARGPDTSAKERVAVAMGNLSQDELRRWWKELSPLLLKPTPPTQEEWTPLYCSWKNAFILKVNPNPNEEGDA